MRSRTVCCRSATIPKVQTTTGIRKPPPDASRGPSRAGASLPSESQEMSLIPPTWTPDRIEELKCLFDAGRTCSQIAREIGVTRNAVIGKLSRLGLTRPRGDNGIPRQPRSRDGALQRQVRILRVLRAQMEAVAPEESRSATSIDARCSTSARRHAVGRSAGRAPMVLASVATRRSRAFLTVRAIAVWPTGRPHVDAAQSCGR